MPFHQLVAEFMRFIGQGAGARQIVILNGLPALSDPILDLRHHHFLILRKLAFDAGQVGFGILQELFGRGLVIVTAL